MSATVAAQYKPVQCICGTIIRQLQYVCLCFFMQKPIHEPIKSAQVCCIDTTMSHVLADKLSARRLLEYPNTASISPSEWATSSSNKRSSSAHHSASGSHPPYSKMRLSLSVMWIITSIMPFLGGRGFSSRLWIHP